MQKSKRILGLLCLNFLIISAGYAQNAARALEVSQMVWGKQGEQYTNTTVPEKWKNESAVILFQDYKFVFDGQGKRVLSENSFHTRLALLDKAAVKEYSEFSFMEKYFERVGAKIKKESLLYTGFKVIKSSGKEIVIDLVEAVEIKSTDENQSKKIAIPNLEIGDIIDFYYLEEEELFLKMPAHAFTPVISTLTSEYPIAYLRMEFNVERNFHVSYKAVNGAPELEESGNRKLRIFKLETRDIERVEKSKWMYANRSLPTIKFQVLYIKSVSTHSERLANFYDFSKKVKRSVTLNDISILAGGIMAVNLIFDQPEFLSSLKGKGLLIENLSKAELAKEIYFFTYAQNVGANLESYLLGDIETLYINDFKWIRVMQAGFRRNKIASRLLIVPNRQTCTHKDLLLLDELLFMIKVVGEEEVYFNNFALQPSVNSIPLEAQGVRAFETELSNGKWAYTGNPHPRIGGATIPEESAEGNNINTISKVSINWDMTGLIFNNSYSIKGLNKASYQEKLLSFSDYLYQEYKLYGIMSLRERTHLDYQQTQNSSNLQDLIERQAKVRKENLLEVLESDYNTDEVDVVSFEVTSAGRIEDPVLRYNAKFNIEDLIKQAGANYLVNAGMLVTTQLHIDEKDRKERKVDIYAPFARSFDSMITLTIPEGYTIEGTEKLNMDVQNETGGLVTTATVTGNELNITYKKWYSNNFEPKENWDKMLAFLDAALAFNEAQILLKKG